MSAPLISRRHLAAGTAAALGAAALPVGFVEALAAELPCTAPAAPATFDPAAFVADLHAAGCRVALSEPGTRFGSGDEAPTYFIRPGPGYCAVIARWSEAMEACSDHVGQVVACLTARLEAGV